MKQIIIIFFFFMSMLMGSVVVPDNYKIHKDTQLSYVYSDEYTHIVPALKTYQSMIMKQYEKEFGYSFDTTMYVGLASLNNQIANGMSTPLPFNSQLYFGAGASAIDYFASPSWLKTLALHESAHNFQLNAKEAKHRKFLYKWFGNSFFNVMGIAFLTLPNVSESSLMFEGNAVMNESRFGNGGRLYSGYALATVVSLAKANQITPALVYNPVQIFPYRERFYLVGGFFQKYLVKKYGIQKVNGYFKALSSHFFTIFTNKIHQAYFGKDFETLLSEFAQDMKQTHQDFHKTKGTLISKSQLLNPMNSDSHEIVALHSDLRSAPKIMRYNKSTGKLSYKKGNWRSGKVFKIDNRYYTQTTAHTTPGKIEMGLYDNTLRQKVKSGSKIFQGALPDGRAVYFDISTSIESPKIFIEGTFYDTSHSSVYVSTKGDLYYFKQKGKTRTLYKNKKPLYAYKGNYGFVCDVDSKGDIYFIAKSEHGSTAYMYDGSHTKRVAKGDDVFDLKLITSSKALVATVGAKGYEYRRISLENTLADVVKTDYALEEKNTPITSYTHLLQSNSTLKTSPYSTLGELHYAYTSQNAFYTKKDGFLYQGSAYFADPLMRNQLSLSLSYEERRQILGLTYSNSTSLLEYGVTAYGVHHSDDFATKERDYGYGLYAQYPFLQTGYWQGNVKLEYIKKYDSFYRIPTTLSINLSNKKQFGYSKLPNSLNQVDAFISEDRKAYNYGISYTFLQDIGWQSRIGLNAAYLKSSTSNQALEKGIRISDGYADIQDESAQLYMPSLNTTLYAKEAKKLALSLYKTFDTPLYFFTFPLSLHRETLYAKQTYYDFDLEKENRQYNETTIGINSDLLLLNKLDFSFTIEGIFNKDVEDTKQIKIGFSKDF